MKIFGYSFGQIRKGLVAAAGVVGELLSLHLLHGTAETWATTAVGVLTVLGTFTVPNDPIPGRHEAPGIGT